MVMAIDDCDRDDVNAIVHFVSSVYGATDLRSVCTDLCADR